MMIYSFLLLWNFVSIVANASPTMTGFNSPATAIFNSPRDILFDYSWRFKYISLDTTVANCSDCTQNADDSTWELVDVRFSSSSYSLISQPNSNNSLN